MEEAAVLELQKDREGAGDPPPILVLLGSELYQPPLRLCILICKEMGLVIASKAPSSANTLHVGLRRLFLDSHMTTNYCTFRAATAQAPANELPFNDHLRPKLGLRGHRTRDGPSLLTVQQHQGLHIAQCSTEVPSLLGCGVF